MPSPRRRLLLAAVVASLGCGKAAEEPHGSPVLLEVLAEVDGFTHKIWSLDPDAGLPATVSANTSKISFVFNRRLDGARIEDTIDGNPAPKANPPITASWPDMATVMSDPPFAADVFYNSLPAFGAGTTYAFMRPRIVGFPSATEITFTLDPNGLTSVYGEPMSGPTEVKMTTSPLSLTLPNSTATVPVTYQAAIMFSTRAPAGSVMKPFVRVSASGTALPFDLLADVTDARKIYVVPTCADGWPSSMRVEIKAEMGVPDGFGRPLGAAATGSFMTSRIASLPVDGACGPLDAGSIDAGTPDAASDAGAPDTAPDVAPDAGAPDTAPDLAPDST
jgi:hypothetical protein